MKKIISVALATLLVLSAVFTVPMVFADDNEPTTKIVNTFEEEGFGTKTSSTSSTLKNNALVASDTYIKSWATASSIVAQLEQVYKATASNAAGVKIYNPYDANFAAFVPEKNTTYKITFDYYYASKSADIELSIYGNTTDDGFKDTKLASAAYIGKNNASITASTKNTATVYVNIGDTEYKSLSIVAELANASKDTEDYWGRIDNITLEKIDTSVIENTYEEGGFGTKTSSTSSTLKNNALVASDTYIKSWTTANSIVAEMQEVYKATASNAAGVKIYNPYDANFAAFVPEKNTTYKITFDYYFASKSADIELSIYGNTTDDGFKDTKLTSAAYIGKNNASIIASTKNTATVYVNIGDTEYKSLSIVAELANASKDNADFWGRIDNIVLTKSEPACKHATTKDVVTKKATYFTTGLKNVVCADDACGAVVEEDVTIDRITVNPITYKYSYDAKTAALTINGKFSDALVLDMNATNGAKFALNYTVAGKDYRAENIPVAYNDEGLKIEIAGFNKARLGEVVKFNLEISWNDAVDAAYTNNAAEFNTASKGEVDVTTVIADEDIAAYDAFETAIATETEKEIGTTANANEAFMNNSYKVNLAEGSAVLKFSLTDELRTTLFNKGGHTAEGRVVTFKVKIGEKTYSATIKELRVNMTVKITGLSFTHMNSDISAWLEFTYAEDGKNFDTSENSVEYSGSKIVADAAGTNAIATAFKDLMN